MLPENTLEGFCFNLVQYKGMVFWERSITIKEIDKLIVDDKMPYEIEITCNEIDTQALFRNYSIGQINEIVDNLFMTILDKLYERKIYLNVEKYTRDGILPYISITQFYRDEYVREPALPQSMGGEIPFYQPDKIEII